MEKSSYVVISVGSTQQRDNRLKEIIDGLNLDPTSNLIFEKEANRVKVYHRVGTGLKILIRTYVVVVITAHINLQPLSGFTGKVNFHLDETIDQLTEIIRQLNYLNGAKEIKASGVERSFQEMLSIITNATT